MTSEYFNDLEGSGIDPSRIGREIIYSPESEEAKSYAANPISFDIPSMIDEAFDETENFNPAQAR